MLNSASEGEKALSLHKLEVVGRETTGRLLRPLYYAICAVSLSLVLYMPVLEVQTNILVIETPHSRTAYARQLCGIIRHVLTRAKTESTITKLISSCNSFLCIIFLVYVPRAVKKPSYIFLKNLPILLVPPE
jgi:hypothetical protein